MIERIEDLPAGVIGLKASGTLTKADYTEVLEPAIEEGVGTGTMRLLFELSDFEGLEGDAFLEDAKTGAKAWIKDHGSWHRFAVVTDVDWVAKSMKMFAWMAPGDVKVFPLTDGDAAREWVAG